MAKDDKKAMRELRAAKADLDRAYRNAVKKGGDKESPEWQKANRRLIKAEDNVSWWNR